MKQALLLTATLLTTGIGARAQAPLTLTPGTHPVSVTTTTHSQFAVAIGKPAPALGANQAWDYSSLQAQGTPFVARRFYAAPAHPAFPTATLAQDYVVDYGSITVEGTHYFSVTTEGLQLLGHALVSQGQDLPTRGSGDGINLLTQHETYAQVYETKLPMTVGSVHKSSYRRVWRGTLTVAAFNLNNASISLVHRVQRTDSVAGWGTLRIPNAAGTGATEPLPVLLRRRLDREIDSVYVNGLPASTGLLAALNLSQGEQPKGRRDDFLRLNSSQPLLSLHYDDPLYSRPITASYSVEPDLIITSARGNRAARGGGIAAYPNPATDGRLTIALGDGRPQPVTLTVFDLTGRPVATARATTGQPSPVLNGLKAGAYVVEARDAHNQRSTVKVNVE